MAAVGVDACRGGWVAIALRSDRPASAQFLTRIDQLADVVPDVDVLAIDIPIGLPDHEPRRADTLARQALGRRRNSIFITPIRAALEAPTHADATAIAVATTGMGISQQAFALRSKIFEVEQWLPRAPCPAYEVHPELSFTTMIGRPAGAPKKSWQGMVERRNALTRHGIILDDLDPQIGAVVGIDDMLDAAAAAWTATRLIAGTAHSFPDPPDVNSAGQSMAIWA